MTHEPVGVLVVADCSLGPVPVPLGQEEVGRHRESDVDLILALEVGGHGIDSDGGPPFLKLFEIRAWLVDVVGVRD